METNIKGVGINLSAPDFKDVKNIKDLQKLNIFSHLEGIEKDEAEKELLTELGVNKAPAPPTV